MTDSISNKKKQLTSIASVLLFLAGWKLLSIKINTDVILPPPERVFKRLIEIFKSENFWTIVFSTTLRTLYGLLISFIFGFVVGIACGIKKTINSLMSPIISITRTTPVMSVILLAMIWFKTDNVPIFVAILMVFPIIVENTKHGVGSVDKKLLNLGNIYKLSKLDILIHITVPSVVPFIIAGLRASIGIAWKVVIAAEVLTQPIRAIGTDLQFSQMNLETADVIAWTVIAIIFSGFSEWVVDFFLAKRRGERMSE